MSPFWILLELRMMDVELTTGAITRARFQSNHHHQHKPIPAFCRPDAIPVAQPTVSEHKNGKYHVTDLLNRATETKDIKYRIKVIQIFWGLGSSVDRLHGRYVRRCS